MDSWEDNWINDYLWFNNKCDNKCSHKYPVKSIFKDLQGDTYEILSISDKDTYIVKVTKKGIGGWFVGSYKEYQLEEMESVCL